MFLGLVGAGGGKVGAGRVSSNMQAVASASLLVNLDSAGSKVWMVMVRHPLSFRAVQESGWWVQLQMSLGARQLNFLTPLGHTYF